MAKSRTTGGGSVAAAVLHTSAIALANACVTHSQCLTCRERCPTRSPTWSPTALESHSESHCFGAARFHSSPKMTHTAALRTFVCAAGGRQPAEACRVDQPGRRGRVAPEAAVARAHDAHAVRAACDCDEPAQPGARNGRPPTRACSSASGSQPGPGRTGRRRLRPTTPALTGWTRCDPALPHTAAARPCPTAAGVCAQLPRDRARAPAPHRVDGGHDGSCCISSGGCPGPCGFGR